MATAGKNRSRAHSPDKSRKRTGRATQPGVEVDLGRLQPVELDTVRRQITNLVGNRALEAVDQTIEQIKRGNFQAMKYLFEIVGLFPVTAPAEAAAPDDSLARKLLSYLETPAEPAAHQGAAGGAPVGMGNVNAVK